MRIATKKMGAPSRLTGREPNRLRALRLAHNLQLQDLADMVGVTPQAISNAESRGVGISKQKWYVLADFFKVPAQVLESPPDFNLPAV